MTATEEYDLAHYVINESDYLAHYGILRKSGRYPWGSGETQSARNQSFLDTIDELRKSGMSEAEVAGSFGMKTTELRALKSIAGNQQRAERISTAQKLKAKGMSNVAIGQQMGVPEATVRNLLKPGADEKNDILQSTADMLRRQVDEKGYIDVGAQVGNQLGISEDKLRTAVSILSEEGGYRLYYPKIQQLGTGKDTTFKVLARDDVPPKEVYEAAKAGGIRQIQEYTPDAGRNFIGNRFVTPISVHPDRVGITYKEQGGDQADGVIYVRPGVSDLSLGHNRYAQVRIQVGEGHYLKGMAIYKDDLPSGVDLQFNTNKSDKGNKLAAMKELKRDKDGNVDQDLPFGALVRQLPKLDEHGREIDGTVRSAMNLVNEDKDWDKWSKTLSTQFLSKQSPTLAKEQLDATYERSRKELDEIKALTQPEIRKRLLDAYADGADTSAVKMKAQALPRQQTQVILPVKGLKDTEVYAPNFRDGERVVLVRYPHGGTFEIPELVVNNKHPEAKALLGQAKNAIGINKNVADRLSGADFDGDTVIVIPNNQGRIKTTRPLEGLKNFDPQRDYKAYDGMKTIDGGVYNAATGKVDYGGKAPRGGNKQNQMGLVSNLITDMTIKGASHDEIAAAVRHSMVVIDAEKHALDYRKSAVDNNIASLKRKYQGSASAGSATLISRAGKSTVNVDARKLRSIPDGGPIDKEGRLVYTPTGEMRVGKDGVPYKVQEKASRVLETKSARELSSGTIIENIYADHSDRMRTLANEARLVSASTPNTKMSPSAKQVYAPQVATLNYKLNKALRNAPRERQAQVVANSIVATKLRDYPELKDDKSQLKKVKGQALVEARARTGASKERVDITPDEWEAIQAGAISSSKLKAILSNTDLDKVKELATPRVPTVATPQVMSRAKAMLAAGYTQADVAAQLGISLTTLKTNI